MTDGAPREVRVGDVVAGKYEVRRVIGRGGVGVVVAAHHTTLDAPVALKFLLPHLANDKEIVARFLREARAAVKLQGEHVARVMDAGSTDDGAAFLAMELLEGRDFAAILKSDGALPIADAVDYVMQACDAVAEAHALGIVHRDLKSANLFLTRGADGLPLVKVLDFGLSKTETSESRSGLTSEHHVFGSIHFMSPEQMRSSRDADVRSDIWALGVVLYAFVAGRVPFEGKFLPEVCSAVLTGAPPSLTSLRPEVSPELEAVVMRCLRVEAAERFQSVAELARALAPFAPARSAADLARIERLIAQRRGGASALSGSITSEPRVERSIAAPPSPPRRVRAIVAIALVSSAIAAVVFAVSRDGDPPSVARALVAGSAAASAALVVPPAPTDALAAPTTVATLTPSAARTRPPVPATQPSRKTKTDEDLIMKLPH